MDNTEDIENETKSHLKGIGLETIIQLFIITKSGSSVGTGCFVVFGGLTRDHAVDTEYIILFFVHPNMNILWRQNAF